MIFMPKFEMSIFYSVQLMVIEKLSFENQRLLRSSHKLCHSRGMKKGGGRKVKKFRGKSLIYIFVNKSLKKYLRVFICPPLHIDETGSVVGSSSTERALLKHAVKRGYGNLRAHYQRLSEVQCLTYQCLFFF